MKLLVVRRDNIGDLVLTTPVLSALRSRYPDARIEVLVNSYNAPVLEGHPDVDAIHVYTKAKHRESRWDAFPEWTDRLRQGLALRSERFDCVIVPSPGFHPRQIRLARWLRPRHISAFCPPGTAPVGVDRPVSYAGPQGRHHVEDTFRILEAFGIGEPMPAPRIACATSQATRADSLLVGVHLSARRPRNRWPSERFALLIRRLHRQSGMRFRLFWAPGGQGDARHPGDDDKAEAVIAATRDIPVEAIETRALRVLIRNLACCDAVICSDGGAMHLAAALGKPIVCFFGDSLAQHWHPWGVPYTLLQPNSGHVADISVDDASKALQDLLAAGKSDAA
jgi:ADP-heptose:LPS heptosyltransferase